MLNFKQKVLLLALTNLSKQTGRNASEFCLENQLVESLEESAQKTTPIQPCSTFDINFCYEDDLPLETTTTLSWEECGNVCFMRDCCFWGWKPETGQCNLFGEKSEEDEAKTWPRDWIEDSTFVGDKNCPVNDCGQRHYANWFQLLSPCFQEKLRGKEITHPELCLPDPNPELKVKIQGVVQKFNATILNSEHLRSLSLGMMESVPSNFKDVCPSDFNDLVSFLLIAVMISPSYLPGAPDHLGVPLQNVLLCLLQSQHGRVFFSHPQVNEAVRDIVNVYGELLRSRDSLAVFNKRQFGWQSECAQQELNMAEFDLPDPEAKAWGFSSFNSWFTRSFKDFKSSRPCPDNPRSLVSIGDVQWFAEANNLQLETPLYIKNERYSLLQIFGNTEKAKTEATIFEGGSLLQVFFSASKYHHFHAPAKGRLLEIRTIPGVVYAVDESNVGWTGGGERDNLTESEKLDLWIENSAEGLYKTELYLAHVATRCVVIMESPHLGGQIALVFIGMVEISSCRVTKSVGDEVHAGDELGFFQYGGSSGLLILSKNIVEEAGRGSQEIWDDLGEKKNGEGWRVCEKLIDL